MLLEALRGTAQRKVMILGTFEARAKTADTAQKIGAVDNKVAKVILRQKQFLIPAAFEIGGIATSLGVEVVHVRVDESQVRMRKPVSRHMIKGIRCEHIIMVKETGENALAHSQRRVGGVANAPVSFAEAYMNSCIPSGIRF